MDASAKLLKVVPEVREMGRAPESEQQCTPSFKGAMGVLCLASPFNARPRAMHGTCLPMHCTLSVTVSGHGVGRERRPISCTSSTFSLEQHTAACNGHGFLLLGAHQALIIYTIWNFRREALTPVFEAGGEPAQKASNTELALTQQNDVAWRAGAWPVPISYKSHLTPCTPSRHVDHAVCINRSHLTPCTPSRHCASTGRISLHVRHQGKQHLK
eukprot:1161061-Pelagomonas_calceolata.AAC.2